MSTKLLGAFLLVALLSTPVGLAAPAAEVEIGPIKGDDGYLLRASVFPAEAPSRGGGADCAADDRPESIEEGLIALLPRPSPSFNGLSPYVPKCVAANADCPVVACAVGPVAYVSYDVESGYYHIEGPGIPVDVHARASGEEWGGRLPFGLSADCEQCPPIP